MGKIAKIVRATGAMAVLVSLAKTVTYFEKVYMKLQKDSLKQCRRIEELESEILDLENVHKEERNLTLKTYAENGKLLKDLKERDAMIEQLNENIASDKDDKSMSSKNMSLLLKDLRKENKGLKTQINTLREAL